MKLTFGVSSLLLLSVVSAFAAQTDRITAAIDSNEAVVLKGSVHPKAQSRFDRGAVDPSMELPYVTMLMKPSASQQADLNRFLAKLQDHNSPSYHKWLTPEQFADRFGLSQHDVEQVQSWLKSQGFRVVQTARGRDWIAFSGRADAVQRTFHTPIHRFEVDGEVHFANATDVSIPQALAGIAVGFRGLDDFRFQPMSKLMPYPTGVFFPAISGPFYTSGGSHFLAPDDVATIYDITPLLNAGIDGAGMKLVVVGQVDLVLSDIQEFRSGFNLPANDPTVVLVPGSPDPGNNSGDLVETDLDLEWSGAVARNAEILFVTAASNTGGVFNSATYAIDQNLAPVISMSYGGCESLNVNFIPANEPTMQKASAEGITFINSSGDTGAAACDAFDAPPVRVASKGLSVNYPTSSPEAVGVGGTTFSADVNNPSQYWNASNDGNGASAIQYIPETSWNDTVERGTLAASGGGKSSCGKSTNGTCTGGFAKPSWQAGTGVPSDGVRDVPDVSMSASPDHDGYMICTQGDCAGGISNAGIVGGTSASAPVFAGIVTLLNQQLGNTTTGVGNINFQLYPLAQTPSNNIFHDVTTGDNKVPCTKGTKDCPSGGTIGYSATAGYDLVTGLGSVDATNLVCKWTPGKTAAFTSLTVNPTQVGVGSHGPVVLTATVAPCLGGTSPTGSVTFSNGVTQVGGPVALSSGQAVFNYDPSTLTAGLYTITAAYGGDANYTSSTSAGVTLTVGTLTTTDFTISPQAVNAGSSGPVTLTATVTSNGGGGTPTNTVTFLNGSSQIGTGTLSNGVANFAYNPGALTGGTYPLTARYDGDANFVGSTSTAQTLYIQDFTVNAAPPTVFVSAPGQNGTTTITITPLGQFGQEVSFSCSGLPSEASCSFNPPKVTPPNAPAQTVLTITTKAPSAMLWPVPNHKAGVFFAMCLPGLAGMILLASVPRRRRTGRHSVLCLLLVLGALTLWMPACGGGSGGTPTPSDPGTPAGSKTVTVTATTAGANGLSHSVAVTVTVQ